MTFHDLFVMTERYSTAEFRARFTEQAKSAAERADLILCVSAFTAAQVQELLHVEAARTRVVWHGVHPLRSPAVALKAREPMILHVGALQTRKNIVRLVEAFESIDWQWRLVLAGSHGFGSEAILQRIEASPARQRIDLAGYVTNDQLQGLYGRAGMLAFPSLDEGFGIPLLEAMVHGIPIVTSNRSALKEVAAGAALLVDPYSVDEIRGALVEAATNEPLRVNLREEGLRRAAQNTWGLAAEETWKVYQELS